MSYGRKDYFWGVAPEKSVFGELQTPIFENDSSAIASGANEYILEYEVSAGYIFQVTGFSVNCSQPGMMHATIWDDDDVLGFYYWDLFVNILFGDGGNLVINPGHTFKVRCYNLDPDISITFYAVVYGYLQQTIV